MPDAVGGAPLTQAELAYFAGFFDGEGCVTIARRISKAHQYVGKHYRGGYISHCVYVQIANTDLRVLEDVADAFGGHIALNRRTRRPHESVCYHWSASARIACAFLRAIRPYSRVKAAQIDVALGFQTMKDWRRVTPEVIAERDSIAARLKALKHAS